MARRRGDEGGEEVSIRDTIGIAVPMRMVDTVGPRGGAIPVDRLAVPFHDARATALADASGSLATEDLLHARRGTWFETGVGLAAVAGASSAAGKAVL